MYHILYVDDEFALLEIGKLFLEQSGEFIVDTIISAPEALVLLEKKRYDAIVSDYQMPGMNGIRFLREVRSRYNQMPFILFTGKGREEVVIQAIDSGVDAYIQKGGDTRSQFADLSHRIKITVARFRAEKALEESEERFRRIVETTEEGIIQLDTHFNIVYINRKMAEIYGTAPEEIVGHNLASFMAAEDLPENTVREQERRQGKSGRYECRYKTKDGASRWIQVSATPLIDPDGTFQGSFAMCYDITDNKTADLELARKNEDLHSAYEQLTAAEEELRQNYEELAKSQTQLVESEQRYKNVVEDQTEFICRFLPDGTHVFVNNAYCRYFGLKREDIIRHRFRPKIPSEDRGAVEKFFASLSPDHPNDTIEHRIIMPDGSVRWQRWSDRAIYDQSGAVTEYQSVGRDITKQKATDEALRESERKLAEAMDLANLTTWECDIRTGILTFDSRFSTLYGTDAQYKGINQMTAQEYLTELVHPEDRQILAEEDEKTRTTNDTDYVSKREYRIIRRDGRVRHIEMCVGIIKDKDGRTIRTHGVNRDITERKEAEKALRESEEWFKAIFATQQNGIMIVDPTNHRIVDVNPYLIALTGLPKDRIVGNICHKFVCPAEQGKCPITDLHQCVDNAERVLIDRDGKKIPIIKTVTPLTLGEKDYLIENIHDITGRKEAEEAIRAAYEQIAAQGEELRQQYDSIFALQQKTAESQQILRQVLDTVPVRVFWKDTSLIYMGSNEAFARDAGFSDPADLTGKTDYDFSKKELAEKYRADDREIISTGIPKTGYEEEIITADGIPIWARTNKVPLRDPEGKITGILGTFENITGYKKAKDELQKSEDKFRSFVENVNDSVFSLLPDGRFSYVSPKITEMLGYEPSEVLGKPSADFVHPDDYPHNREFFRQTMATGKKTTGLVYRVRHKNGTWLWHSQNGSVIRNAQGDVIAFYGIARDITEQKKAADALRESEEKFRSFVENANEILFSLTVGGIFTYVSPMWTEMLGQEISEVVGKPAADFMHPDDLPKNREVFLEAIRTGKKKSGLEYRVRHKNGTWQWHSLSLSPVHDARGTVVALQGICHNITEQKTSADALRRANRQLGLLTGITRHDILNKVAALHGYLALIQMQSDDPHLVKYLGKMESATSTIHSQIEFTRIYQDLGTLEPQWIEPDLVIPRLQVPGTVVLTSDVKGIAVFADPMLEKVFSNLLDNSVRHGETVTEIRITTRMSPGNLNIVWEDNGTGIAADDKERIFDRGFGKNTGLGLFLVREILSLTGITITETGEPGKGARFEILVPVDRYRFVKPEQ